MDKRYTALSPFEQMEQRRQLMEDIMQTPSLSPQATVRRLRQGLRMTLNEYARLSGVSARAIHEIENGLGNPTLATLEKLLKPFGMTVGAVQTAPQQDNHQRG
jgi:DNA-binding XRE family transcriptional regulator